MTTEQILKIFLKRSIIDNTGSRNCTKSEDTGMVETVLKNIKFFACCFTLYSILWLTKNSFRLQKQSFN